MFRKLFWMVVLLAGYLWVVSSEDDSQVTKIAKTLYDHAEKKWKDLDLTWHIHTPDCLKKKR